MVVRVVQIARLLSVANSQFALQTLPKELALAVTPPESDTAPAFTEDAERGGISSSQRAAKFGDCPVHAAIGV
jgi:hypothetical protein